MNKSHIDHAAIRVRDLEWHHAFFRDALAMKTTEIQGGTARPDQVWIGGVQLTRDESYAPRPQAEERVWHIGVAVRDVEKAAKTVAAYPGVAPFSTDPGQQYWFLLPEGLVIELVER